MVPGDVSEWSWGIFAKKAKFHDAGGPGTVVSPIDEEDELVLDYEQDDLSDMEAARHQLRVDKDQKYIPLPRRFSHSRRRRWIENTDEGKWGEVE